MTDSPAPGRAGPEWTPKSLLDWTEGFFRSKGVQTPRLDGELLLAHVLHCRRLDLYLQFDRPLAAAELSAYRELVVARAARTPVAYLLGSVGFWNLTLAIRPGVLIPGPDTETLVESVLQSAQQRRAALGVQPLRVLELGPGSGAIPLAACAETQGLTWVAVERSAQAIAVAAENRARHAALLAPKGNALHLVRGDRFAAIAPGAHFDLLVSNPPYIASAALGGLMPEVAQAQPHEALDGGASGLEFHEYLLTQAQQRLAPGGWMLLEIGFDQEAALTQLLARQPHLQAGEFLKDLGGQPRVLRAQRA